MTIEQLKKVHGAQPFQPFTICMADGRELRVPHRELMSHSPNGRTVIVHEDDDNYSVIDLLLVAGLQVHTASGSKDSGRGNGHASSN